MGLTTLSPKQQETTKVIFKLTQAVHYPPTLDEIAKEMGITKGTLQYHISALKKKNIINWTKGAARSIQVICEKCLQDCAKEIPAPVNHSSNFESIRLKSLKQEFSMEKAQIPILGQIAAGKPLELMDQSEEYLELDSYFPQGCFALRVKGESMIDAFINDGDIVLIEPTRNANNGQIVVALIDGEASTLKRFYKKTDGTIMLKPENPYMDPIYLDASQTLDIQGIVKGVIRKL
jgi:repressor LexA